MVSEPTNHNRNHQTLPDTDKDGWLVGSMVRLMGLLHGHTLVYSALFSFKQFFLRCVQKLSLFSCFGSRLSSVGFNPTNSLLVFYLLVVGWVHQCLFVDWLYFDPLWDSLHL